MHQAADIIRNTDLDYPEKRHQLAAAAESEVPPVSVSPATQQLIDTGILCTLFEGNAPYRPRYVLPDFQRLMRNGSEYLGLTQPKDLFDAVNALLITYRFVPSITGYPVYLGQIDELLEPYWRGVGEAERMRLLEMFLVNVDRTLPDAFVHMNIGPRDTEVGRAVLSLEGCLQKSVPNLSLKCDGSTTDELLMLAVDTALKTNKPYFVNHSDLCRDLGPDYGIASCYNTLPIGGGSHTLVRVNLKALAQSAHSYEDFLERLLPDATHALCELINARARFLVEQARFFDTSFLAREGLISLDRFTSMAGVFGLFEAVEVLSGGGRMGHEESASAMAEEVLFVARDLVKAQQGAYCGGLDGHIGFHAQAGLDTDMDATPGARIKNGCEPGLFDQIRLAGRLQRCFDTGTNDIYEFEPTAKDNKEALLRVIRGALEHGVRLLSVGGSDSDLVRISGYLVKRSDLAKYAANVPLREQTARLGALSHEGMHLCERAVRKSDASGH